MEVVYQCAARGEQRAAVAQEGIAVEGWRRRLITAVASQRCLTTRRMLAVAVVVVNACGDVRVHQLSRVHQHTSFQQGNHKGVANPEEKTMGQLGSFGLSVDISRGRLALCTC